MTATVDSSGSAAPRARAQKANGHGAPFPDTSTHRALPNPGELPEHVITFMAEASAELGEIATMLAERADEAQDWLVRGMAQRIDTLNNLIYSLADGELETAKKYSQAAYGRTLHLCHGVPA